MIELRVAALAAALLTAPPAALAQRSAHAAPAPSPVATAVDLSGGQVIGFVGTSGNPYAVYW